MTTFRLQDEGNTPEEEAVTPEKTEEEKTEEATPEEEKTEEAPASE